MEEVQGQYGCTVLAEPEMSPHCLTVLTLLTAITIIFLIITCMLSSIITVCVTTALMLEFIVQVPNCAYTNPCGY